MKRPRSTAARCVGVADYKAALRAWREPISMTYAAILGPRLAQDLRCVAPHHVVQLCGLFDKLIAAGLTNAMILPSSLRQALQEIFAQDGCAGQQMGLDLFAHNVSKHISQCFSMLRIIEIERRKVSKFSKSSAFLRRCSTAEHAVISQLTSKLCVSVEQSCDADHVSADESAAAPSSVVSAEESAATPSPVVSAEKSAGISWTSFALSASFSGSPVLPSSSGSVPLCFGKYLEKAAASRSSSVASIDSIASTVYYDEDGQPLMTDKEKPIQNSSNLLLQPAAPQTPLASGRVRKTCHCCTIGDCFSDTTSKGKGMCSTYTDRFVDTTSQGRGKCSTVDRFLDTSKVRGGFCEVVSSRAVSVQRASRALLQG